MTTIVSCFYLLEKNKYNNNIYDKWLNNFIKIETPIVLFTNEKTKPYLEQKIIGKNNFKILVVEFEDFKTYKYLNQFKEQHQTLDNEKKKHNVFLYLIWNEKIEFVKKAIYLNPFQTQNFLYSDAGYFRNNSYTNWPNPKIINQLPKNKVSYFLICPFTQNELKCNKFEKLPTFDHGRNKNDMGVRFAGGIFYCHQDFFPIWYKIYYKFLDKFSKSNKFMGKDQSIINSIYLIKPNFFHVIKCSKNWFYPQKFLE